MNLMTEYECLQGLEVTEEEILQLTSLREVFIDSNIPRRQAIEKVGADHYRCVRCDCQDQIHIREQPPLVYCLNCIQMGRMSSASTLYHFAAQPPTSVQPIHCEWQGTLSEQQKNASQQLVQSLTDTSKPDLIYAVTGSGKTEIIFNVIEVVLSQGGRVCLASPRIDVCLELLPRIRAAFTQVDCILLYGGRDEIFRYTPIVISTTHQLLRFREAFDLLIVDEVDSFPYVHSESLHYAVHKAVKENGKLIYLTATPDAQLKRDIATQKVNTTILSARYHRYPLPEPEFVWIGDWYQAIQQRNTSSVLWRRIIHFIQIDGAKLIFLPHIDLAEQLYEWITQVLPQYPIACVHSKDSKRKEKIHQLREETLEVLITTTILERGVTFTNCHVFVVGSEHRQFNASTLVQISGRVGRRPDYPMGTLIYGHYGKTLAMREARRDIQRMNQRARSEGLLL